MHDTDRYTRRERIVQHVGTHRNDNVNESLADGTDLFDHATRQQRHWRGNEQTLQEVSVVVQHLVSRLDVPCLLGLVWILAHQRRSLM